MFSDTTICGFYLYPWFDVLEIPRDHPESYHSFMWNNLFKHIDIPAENVNLLDGNAEDLMAECDQYEEKILKAGGIDLFVGGKIYLSMWIYTIIVYFIHCVENSLLGLEFFISKY